MSVEDDDDLGVMVVTAADPLEVAEGGSATYTVELTAAPSGTVTVTPSLAAGSDEDVTVTSAVLTFTASTTGTRRRR